MFRTQRRTAMKVRNGRVQRKNRHAKTPHYFHAEMASLVIDRLRPGLGCRHVVRKEHVRRFLPLLPNWHELSRGLNAIVLAAGNSNCMGWHQPGVVAICAWDREIEWDDCDLSFSPRPDDHSLSAEIMSGRNLRRELRLAIPERNSP
ncbi:MAG: hypothetical protein HY000_30250 [Planctomycetes bacterium]|nr:hypothetical protein [Planctomycetota bacterium]